MPAQRKPPRPHAAVPATATELTHHDARRTTPPDGVSAEMSNLVGALARHAARSLWAVQAAASRDGPPPDGA
jgi:hypothetical protein